MANNVIGKNIAELRKSKGITQECLAEYNILLADSIILPLKYSLFAIKYLLSAKMVIWKETLMIIGAKTNKKIITLALIILSIGILQYFVSYNIYLKYYNEPMETAFGKVFDLIKENTNVISTNKADIDKIINDDLRMFKFNWLAIYKEMPYTTAKNNIDQIKSAEYLFTNQSTPDEIEKGLLNGGEATERGRGDIPGWKIRYQYKNMDPLKDFEKYSRLALLLCVIAYWAAILFVFGYNLYSNRKINNKGISSVFALIGVLAFALFLNR